MDVFNGAQDHDGHGGSEDHIRRNCKVHVSAFILEAHDVQVVFPSYIHLLHCLADPFLWSRHFEDSMDSVKLYVVQDMV